MAESSSPTQRLEVKLADPHWRLSNLYWIVDEDGETVLFKPNEDQKRLYKNLWYKNVILKARQRGFTTAICLLWLDSCLFQTNLHAGIIAHTKPDSVVIFRDKVKFPYDHLDDELRAKLKAKIDTANEFVFSNGSSIRVATSVRSGTLQRLLVSEYGKISRMYPEKAREIATGSFQTVHTGSILVVESTAEGRDGNFYKLVEDARNDLRLKRPLTMQSWRFMFHAWWENPAWTMSPAEAATVAIPTKMMQYFAGVEKTLALNALKYGTKAHRFTQGQRAWYYLKWREIGDDMKREYPATPDEAFEAAIQGAFYKDQMAKMREEKRLTQVPHTDGIGVDTWWDIGMDGTAIWFTQDVGARVHAIDYSFAVDMDLQKALDLLDRKKTERNFRYRRHVGPHDIDHTDYSTGETRKDAARKRGYEFEVCPRPNRKEDHIDAGGRKFSVVWMDDEHCADGANALDSYRREWDEHLGTYKPKPLHDWSSHGADAWQVFSVMHQFLSYGTGSGYRPPAPTGRRF